jgi:hypothetical protein
MCLLYRASPRILVMQVADEHLVPQDVTFLMMT